MPLIRRSQPVPHLSPTAVGLLSLVLGGCASAAPAASAELIVPATDYAFQVPRTLPAGPVTIRMDNQGKVPHEMALGRLKAGVTADSVLAFVSSGGNIDELADGVVGILISGPGEKTIGTLSTDLVPGRTYMMICQFRDADSLPPHIAMGMQASFVAQ